LSVAGDIVADQRLFVLPAPGQEPGGSP
jgi:hypothetical protein